MWLRLVKLILLLFIQKRMLKYINFINVICLKYFFNHVQNYEIYKVSRYIYDISVKFPSIKSPFFKCQSKKCHILNQ